MLPLPTSSLLSLGLYIGNVLGPALWHASIQNYEQEGTYLCLHLPQPGEVFGASCAFCWLLLIVLWG